MPDNKNILIKNLLILCAVIILSTLLIRGLTSGETLLDYAAENSIPIYSGDEEK